MARADQIIRITPDANLPPWSLYVDDDSDPPQPVPYVSATVFTVHVRTAATVVAVAGSMTAHAAASLTRYRGLPDDVPSLRFTPTAASLAQVPDSKRRATVLVYVGAGNVERLDFAAQVEP